MTSFVRAFWLMPAIGGVIGCAAFVRCVGLPALNVKDLNWILPGGIDPSIHVIGWHLFRFSPWGLPPGATSTLGYPVGTSVALTDSIPLLALPLKMVSDALPDPFQYIGPWLLLCFVLQGVFGSLLMGIATRRPLLQLLGTSMFVLSPVLAHRLGQAALSAHWLLLASLWLNRRAATNGITVRDHVGWALLAVTAGATHPYLTLMVFAIAGATYAGHIRATWRLVVTDAGACLALGLLVLATWWTAGYFVVPESSALRVSGFGRLSMNLLSPLIPREGAWTFGRIPLTTAHYDQHEGFAYLGLGTCGLIAVAGVLWRPRQAQWRTRPNVMLIITCVVLTLFALSPVITIGTRTLLEYDEAWWGPLTTFRASGRMFWPVFYALLFGALSVAARRLPFRAALIVLALAVGLQWVDMAGVYRLKRERFAMRFDNPLQSPFWRDVPSRYRHLVMYPSNMCVPPDQAMDYRPLALVAGSARLTFNGGYAARYDVAAVATYCARLADEMQLGLVSDDTLYVVPPAVAPTLLAARTEMTCIPVDHVVACVTTVSQIRSSP